MTKTELILLAIYRAPAIKLEDVARQYLGMDPKQAYALAAMNRLEIPTFRMRDSKKASRLVKSEDLASYIDSRASEAAGGWKLSQV